MSTAVPGADGAPTPRSMPREYFGSVGSRPRLAAASGRRPDGPELSDHPPGCPSQCETLTEGRLCWREDGRHERRPGAGPPPAHAPGRSQSRLVALLAGPRMV